MNAQEMIESVLQGKQPSALVREAATSAPSWHPGEKVPEGYIVVFGKLAKKGSAGSEHPGHIAGTAAWNATANANQTGSKKDHFSAERLHDRAARLHGDMDTNMPGATGWAHISAHDTHADWSERHAAKRDPKRFGSYVPDMGVKAT